MSHLEVDNIPRGTLFITIASASQYLVMGLFYVVVTNTNALTPADIGILSILSFFASIFFLFTALALPTALTKFTSEKLGRNQRGEAAAIFRTVTKIVLILSLLGFVAAVIFSEQLSLYFWGTSDYALLIILMVSNALLFNIIALLNSGLQALHLFVKMALVSLVSIVTSRMIGSVLAILNMGLKGVVIGYIVGSSITLITALTFLKGKFPKTTHNTPIDEILRFSTPIFLSQLLLLVLNWADVVLVNALTGNSSLTGVYYIVINSVNVLSILWIPVTTTIFPALSARHGINNPEGISAILKTSSRYLSYMILPSCIGLAIISPTALTIFYGSNYMSGALPLSVLSIATIITGFYSLFTTALTAIGKTTEILKISTISAITTITMLLTFVPFLSAIGAAIARLTMQIVSLALTMYVLRKHLETHLDKESLWKSAIASTAMIPFLIATEFVLRPKISALQALIIEISVSVSIYVLGLYIIKALNNQDFELLRQSFPKFMSKYISILENIIVR